MWWRPRRRRPRRRQAKTSLPPPPATRSTSPRSPNRRPSPPYRPTIPPPSTATQSPTPLLRLIRRPDPGSSSTGAGGHSARVTNPTVKTLASKPMLPKPTAALEPSASRQFHRIWSDEDENTLLTGIVDYMASTLILQWSKLEERAEADTVFCRLGHAALKVKNAGLFIAHIRDGEM